MAYSLDHGVTWTSPGLKSGIYTVNTQPLMYKYDLDGDGVKEASVFLWGGNNMQGGNSYIRNPLNYAVSINGMDTFRNIQNAFAETFMEVYTQEASHYITNASGHMVNGDDMYVAFGRLKHGDSVYMHITNLVDWFTRTKGAYDAFEHGNARYEGWVPYKGSVIASEDMASERHRSMRVAEYTNVTRSVPYLQNGKISMDIWVNQDSDFTAELQPAYTAVAGKGDLITFTVEGTTLKLANGQTLELISNQWNTITLDLELTEGEATVSANDITKTIPVDLDLGDYVCYITLDSIHPLYLDALLVTSRLDAVTSATEEDEAAAEDVIGLIEAIGDVTAADVETIHAARKAYNGLTPAQRDLVNRRVRLSEADSDVKQNKGDDVSRYMINYYQVLLAAEEAIVNYLPSFGGFLTLNETIDLCVVLPAELDPATCVIEVTKATTTSVSKFAAAMISANISTNLNAMLIRMLDYGTLAQLYANTNTDDLANRYVSAQQRATLTNYAWPGK